jgi:hypothetical protein
VSSGKILFDNSAISYESNMRLVIGLEALDSEMRVKEARSYSERSRGKSTMGWGGEKVVVMGGVSFWSWFSWIVVMSYMSNICTE